MADWNCSNRRVIAGANGSNQASSESICSGFWLTKSENLVAMKLGKNVWIGSQKIKKPPF
jgi:hypothetical protein